MRPRLSGLQAPVKKRDFLEGKEEGSLRLACTRLRAIQADSVSSTVEGSLDTSADAATSVIEAILTQLQSSSLGDALEKSSRQIRELVPSDGVMVCWQGVTVKDGVAPRGTEHLLESFGGQADHSELLEIFDGLPFRDEAVPGVLAFRFGGAEHGYIAWYRRELREGSSEATSVDHRHALASWPPAFGEHCDAWSAQDRSAARTLRSALEDLSTP